MYRCELGRKNTENIKERELSARKGCTVRNWEAEECRKVLRTQEMWQMRIKGEHSALLRGCQLSPGINEAAEQKSRVQRNEQMPFSG